jgi:hypothetical protein
MNGALPRFAAGFSLIFVVFHNEVVNAAVIGSEIKDPPVSFSPGIAGSAVWTDILRLRRWFERPDADMRRTPFCRHSGMLPGVYCADVDTGWVCPAGLASEPCRYCRLIHTDESMYWRVTSECASPSTMRPVSWFVCPRQWSGTINASMESTVRFRHSVPDVFRLRRYPVWHQSRLSGLMRMARSTFRWKWMEKGDAPFLKQPIATLRRHSFGTLMIPTSAPRSIFTRLHARRVLDRMY